MRSIHRAQHASSSSSTRTLLGTGLTALLLPLCLATPALAEGTAQAAAGSTAKAATTMRISAPSAPVAAGRQRIGVRLLEHGRLAPNAVVEVQKRTAAGWAPSARVRTDAAGHAVVRLSFTSTTAVRAVFPGSAKQAPSATPARTVTVRKAALRRAPSSFRAAALQVARAQAGKPYRWGAAGPGSFDCSGLVRFAFSKVGRSLPHSSSALRATTKRISKAAAQPGDLIFIPGHVGIYAGGGKMVDAPRAGKNVSLRRIYTGNYTVGRVV